MWGEDEKKAFREGFTGSKKPKKRKLTFQERHEQRMANMSEEEKAERQRKIDEQSSGYEDGGICEGKFKNIKKKLKK
jgi:hypothetical protein